MKGLLAAALCLGIAAPLWCQVPALLSFEVASIKQEDIKLANGITGGVCHGIDAPGPQVGIPGMTVALGRCRYVGTNVMFLINNAYGGVAGDRIIGGPDWIRSLPFSIDAKAEEGSAPTRAQLIEMMRTLLEDRFKLKYHREMREVPGYSLIIGKNGIKLKESAEGTRGGVMGLSGSISGSMPMPMLANLLTRAVGGPVTDSTCLTAKYDIDLKWSPDTNQPATNNAGQSAILPADPTGPSIFTAVQELGLRLEPKKSSIELFVIDSIEKPDSN
jgi:uncharacterized protein (TIGR03435 family)